MGLESTNIFNDMKTKIFSFLVGSLVAVASFGQESGTWGSLTWSFDGVETLTISGNGEILGDASWSGSRRERSITNVIIGEGVTSIGRDAFGGWSLTSITIPNSVTSIGEYAFGSCHALTSITIPSSVTSIGEHAFGGCSSLTSITIPEGVTNIGEHAFWVCSSLTSITIPSSVTSIGLEAFSGCSSLTSINVENGNVNYSSLDGVLFNKDKTTLIKYPYGKTGDYIIPNYVLHIGDRAFAGYPNQSIVIPDGVTSVGDYAFSGCRNLTYASVGNKVLTIGDGAFDYCYKLVSISLGESLNSIGSHVFGYYPSQLRNIYCYGKVAANCTFDSFSYDNYFDIYRNVRLHYPANASGYTTSPVWREFENRFYLDIEERVVTVKPSTNNTQQLTIPPVSGAAAYDLVIYADANRTDVVCTISFDAEGRLTGIMLRGGDDMPFSCTVNGLKGGTTYHYTMTAYNSDQEIIEQKMGSFKTEGEGTGVVGALHATPLPEIIGYYTLLGQKLPQEPQRGIYIILYDNGKSEKIMKYKE